MSFALKCLSVCVAVFVVFAAPQLGSAKFSGEPVSVDFTATNPVIGRSIGLRAQLADTGSPTQVFFYVGDTSTGTTTVTIAGQSVTLPVANATFASSATASNGTATSAYYVPRDKSLIGMHRRAVAAIVVNGQVIVSAIMASGPILGDDIS